MPGRDTIRSSSAPSRRRSKCWNRTPSTEFPAPRPSIASPSRILMTRLSALLVLTCTALHGQLSYSRADSMIPMRDGVHLYTQVFAPAPAAEPLPILLIRTPYGTGDLDSTRLIAGLPELAADRYIFVMQDIRGRFKSEGSFVMLRQPRDPKDKKAIDESTDT